MVMESKVVYSVITRQSTVIEKYQHVGFCDKYSLKMIIIPQYYDVVTAEYQRLSV